VALLPINLFADEMVPNVEIPNDLEIMKYAVQKYTNEQDNNFSVDIPNTYTQDFLFNGILM